MHYNLHQQTAALWLTSSIWGLSHVVRQQPDLAPQIAWGVVYGVCWMALMPALMRVALLRAAFCWTDALSREQCVALREWRVAAAVRAGRQDGVSARLKPFALRLSVASVVMGCAGAASYECNAPHWAAGAAAFGWVYPAACSTVAWIFVALTRRT